MRTDKSGARVIAETAVVFVAFILVLALLVSIVAANIGPTLGDLRQEGLARTVESIWCGTKGCDDE